VVETTPKGYPARTERLPDALSAITAEWLERTLKNRYPDIAIDSLKIIEVIEGHTTKVRIEIGGGAPLPSKLCLKSNWSGSPLSGEANVNEARFYKDLSEGLALPAPNCFYADWDEDEQGKQGLLVLEDMTYWGGEFGLSAKPITVSQAMKGVEALAQLHGQTWGDPRLDRAGWLYTAMAPENVVDDYWMLMESHFHRVNRLPERIAIFPDWFAQDPDKLRTAWLQLRDHDLALPGPRCLVHGDAHLGNTYGLADGGRLFLDWQIVRKGHPFRDYSYFAIGSITVEDRRAAERDLLRHYLTALASYGVEIAFEVAWQHYRRWVIWGLIAWQSNINPQQDTMASLERFCAAAKDLKIHELYDL
jgi:hypothetical protein